MNCHGHASYSSSNFTYHNGTSGKSIHGPWHDDIDLSPLALSMLAQIPTDSSLGHHGEDTRWQGRHFWWAWLFLSDKVMRTVGDN